MDINLNNYEAYFLDFHEGSLSPALVEVLMNFIAQHPELKEEFESFESISLNDGERITYDRKDALKKSLTGINSANFNDYAIEYVEGNLPAAVQQELKVFIGQNPSYQKELDLYTKTKLTPDTSIVFDDKHSLKRENRRPAAFYYWSAAASVALIIGAYFMLNRNENVALPLVVKQDQVKDSNRFVVHNANPIDTYAVVPTNLLHIPANSTALSANKHVQKMHPGGNTLFDNLSKDSSAVAASKKANDNFVAPVKNASPVLTQPDEGSLAYQAKQKDTPSVGMPIIKEVIGSTTSPEVTSAEVNPEKKGSKFFYLLAKLTCRGVHQLTREPIRMEEKFDADTTRVVAYQLNLGKKKLDFPVKE